MKLVFVLFSASLVIAIAALVWFMTHSGAGDVATSATPATGGGEVDRGALRFGICAVCHGQDGSGVSGKGPSLHRSRLANGPGEMLVRAILSGIAGGRHPDGNEYWDGMAAQAWLPDDDLAAVANFVRRSFDNKGAPVTPADVTRIRNANALRQTRYTRVELGLP